MLFNSWQFLVYFPIVTGLYFALPYRFRWVWLLAASVYFYMAFIPVYILILAFTILIDYVAGRMIENAQGRRRKLFLVASIVANIGVLAFFKYFNFLNVNLEALAAFLRWNYPIGYLGILLPIGLSFHTFQSLSYTIEVYRGHYPAEKNPGIFALYVMFYPQLVAGPIERPQHLLPQFHSKHDFDAARVTSGLRLMLWGFFKKVVIADQLAVFVNLVYNNPTHETGLTLILATVLFAYQIYCDFSGYTDIARGAARVMGIELMRNFDQPYSATSIAEFWRKWHISLSTWFRDYLYIPLGGNRVPKWRWYFNLFITFLLSGLWHGANWTFVIWGALHGSYLVLSIWTEGARARLIERTRIEKLPRLYTFAQVAVTFALVCFAWIFFRAATLTDAWYIVTHLLSQWSLSDLLTTFWAGTARIDFVTTLIAIVVMEAVELLHMRGALVQRIVHQPAWVRWAAYYLLIMYITLFGRFSQQQFIYFQF